MRKHVVKILFLVFGIYVVVIYWFYRDLRRGYQAEKASENYLSPDVQAIHGHQLDLEDNEVDVLKRKQDVIGLEKLEELSQGGHQHLMIYIYPLASKYNEDILKCVTDNQDATMCMDLTNNGFGEKVHSIEGINFHRTHQFSAEVIFHHKLLQSKYLTTDPKTADLVYIPYYGGLDCLCRNTHKNDLLVNTLWDDITVTDKPFFTVLGRSEKDLSHEHCNILNAKPPNLKVKYLLVETIHEQNLRDSANRKGKEEEVIVIPFPSYYHFQGDEVSVFGANDKDILVFMAGNLRNSPLRTKLAEQLRDKENGHYQALDTDDCSQNVQLAAHVLPKLMRRSTFCLQPPGDSPTRKGFFDSLLSSCIPIIFKENIMYPFYDYFDYTEFSIYVNEKDILEENQNIFDILSDIPGKNIRDMQKKVAEYAKYFQYGNYSTGEDAFSMALIQLAGAFQIAKSVLH